MPEILYCGDTELRGAASYLAGMIAHAGWTFDYVASDVPLTEAHLHSPHRLYLFSDYPAPQASTPLQQKIVQAVAAGAGLLMIGGWESFHGLGGDWDGTPIGNILPVEIGQSDDRVNSSAPLVMRPVAPHPITANLPWQQSTPAVGGMNRVTPKTNATTLLEAVELKLSLANDGNIQAQPGWKSPLLVTGTHQQGNVATFLSDAAPHWVGGFVDWGPKRVAAQAPSAPAVETGNWYAQFWQQLLRWVGKLP